ncbi:MAG: ATP-binding cassette domain-containing protein, partial [Anaerolineae bacterium]|nr:ATP-binding cassette domain-containing protein [Anaerolineae bacterium]
MITLQEVTFAYRASQPLFQGLDWHVAAGEHWTILGPSGCGKTTLLKLMAGLVMPQGGAVRVHGQSLTRPRPGTGLILQDYGLLPWSNAWHNVALGLKIRRFLWARWHPHPTRGSPAHAPRTARDCGGLVA